MADKIKEGLNTVKDTFRLGYESLYKGDKQAEKDYLERKKSKERRDPFGGDRTPPVGMPRPDTAPSTYKKGGAVKCMARGGGVEIRGKTRGKLT